MIAQGSTELAGSTVVTTLRRPATARSIEWHLAILCAALALPILIFVGWLLWQYTGAERQRLEQRRIETLEKVVGSVERDLALLRSMAELAASAPLLTSGSQPSAEASLRELSERLAMEITLRSPTGQNLFSTAGSAAGSATSLRDDEREALDLKRARISVRAADGAAAPEVLVLAPVFRPGTSEPVALLSFSAGANRVRKALAAEEHATGVTTTVLDPTGLVIASHGSGAGLPPNLSPLSVGESGTVGRYSTKAQDGTPVLVEYARLMGSDWVVSATVSEQALQQPLRRFMRQLLGTTVALALFSAALAFAFGRRISRAINELSGAATALGQSHAVAQVETGIAQVDEVGRVLGVADRAIRQGQGQQALLNRELHHRVKNTIATVQALIRLSARSADSAESLRDSLTSRIASVGATHDLLLGSGWAGASLQALLKAELDPYQDASGERVRMSGPDVELPPDVALAIGMMMHELATNAAKYGAFSETGGGLSVSWDITGPFGARTLSLRWQESGGGGGESGKEGFGSDLLERLAQQLGATMTREFSPTGLTVDLAVPLDGAAST